MLPSIEQKYTEQEYIRTPEPYTIYLRALERVFDLSVVDSFADLGCSSGRLIEHIHAKYPHVELFGFEYFEWAKKYADPSIKDYIHLGDLSKPLDHKKQYSMVNCTEVGEHIEKEAEDTLLANIASITKDVLILTWSNEAHDGDGQHVNPRTKGYIIRKMRKHNLLFWREATYELKNTLELLLEGVGHTWWPENIMVFKKHAFVRTKSRYFVQGIWTDDGAHKKYLAPGTLRNYGDTILQMSFRHLAKNITSAVATRTPFSILRASDGDYFFLREIEKGSAAPGRRALLKKYRNLPMALFRSMFWHNDVITTNLGPHAIWSWRIFITLELPEKILRKIFKKRFSFTENKYVRYGTDLILTPFMLFGVIPYIMAVLYSIKRGEKYFEKAFTLLRGTTTSCEAVYALIATRWIFRNYKNDIALVANKEKLDIIKELIKYPEYRNYIGVESFCDYIEVPQKGAADTVVEIAQQHQTKIKHSKAKIFLVGAGSSKIALIPLLQMYSDAVFIDVGAGIDALAGIVCQERPFFANWVNYRIKKYDYSRVDFMDQGNPAWEKPEYVTKFLD